MAKKASIPSFLLFASASALITAGWLMASFPLLIFMGLAPLFALADRTDSGSPVWEKMEHILVALSISFACFSLLHEGSIVASLVASITLTLAFVAHAWVRQTLGSRTGKITIVLFWLSIEYLFLKLNPDGAIFLADSLRLQPEWTRWNVHTGYLGSSLWILLVNWCLYKTFLSDIAIRWAWLPLGVFLWMAPAVYSCQLEASSITREDMINLYAAVPIQTDVTYLARGEFVVRTATWLSALILLFTLVKSQTARR